MLALPEGVVRRVPKAGQQTGTSSQRNVLNGPKGSSGAKRRALTSTVPAQQRTSKILLWNSRSSEVVACEKHPLRNTPGRRGAGSAGRTAGGRQQLVQTYQTGKRDAMPKARKDNTRGYQHRYHLRHGVHIMSRAGDVLWRHSPLHNN